jgi:hypothetical protein
MILLRLSLTALGAFQIDEGGFYPGVNVRLVREM